MTSFISWLDYDERDRQLVLHAVESLAERQARDELGLSTIRDAFANEFFPGTSTIQTRLKYFLFIPWMFLEVASKSSKRAASARIRQMEELLIDALKTEEQSGVIGARSGRRVQRMPSVIYWNGLFEWGIRRTSANPATLCRTIDRGSGLDDLCRVDDDGNLTVSLAGGAWDPGLPKAPEDFLKVTSFQLTRSEANYLAERMVASDAASRRSSLLAKAVQNLRQNPRLLDDELSELPWESQLLVANATERQKRHLQHAEAFSCVTHGAWILYNYMLAEQLPDVEGPDDTVADKNGAIAALSEALDEWRNEVLESPTLQTWNIDEFWNELRQLIHVRDGVYNFVQAWVQCAPWRMQSIASDERLRTLISNREKAIKGSRARIGNPRALEHWSGQAGLGRTDYRWRIAQAHLRDLAAGLKNGEVK